MNACELEKVILGGLSPLQTVVVPLIVTVGVGLTVIVAAPVVKPLVRVQLASATDTSV